MNKAHPTHIRFVYGLATLITAMVFYACANVVSPTGGPIDEDPPEVVRSEPPNYSANFSGDEIRIYFDEFIRLSNIRQQLLISPPLEQRPEVNIRGRSIVMEIEEELLPETTYNFFFGDAIRDITEGNTIPNFQFVVSTGDYVDSLSVAGQVRNARNLEPEEGIYVMLYENIYDSVPYQEQPVYLAKTGEQGNFTISNIREGEYLMFALEDQSGTLKFDLPDERIAFLDSLAEPKYKPAETFDKEDPEDTIEEEATEEATEEEATEETPEEIFPEEAFDRESVTEPGLRETEEDSLSLPDREDFYTLYLFRERDTVQRITSYESEKRGLINIEFRIPFDSTYVREIREPFDEPWHIPEFGPDKQVLKLWFTDIDRDSLFLEVWDKELLLDTIALPTSLRREPDPEEEQVLNIAMTYNQPSAVPYFEPLAVESEHPLDTFNQEQVQLLAHDSIPVETSLSLQDQARRIAAIEPLPEENTPYSLTILPNAFTDIYGNTNDTLNARFSTTSFENYGRLIMDVTLPHPGEQYILQLLNTDEEVLQQKLIHEDDTYRFEYLRQGNYKVRLIHDIHENGEWLTGDYLKKRQPEPVYMFPENIQVRENWDVEMPWVVGPAK
ncbi:MAG: Ig-like domain-containing domain [Bacteroidales bacterium]